MQQLVVHVVKDILEESEVNRLFYAFGDLSTLLCAKPEDLVNIGGLSKEKAMLFDQYFKEDAF